MRWQILVALCITGCATAGIDSGLSGEAENRLRSLGPDINREFALAGSSLDIDPGRQLSILVRDGSFSSLADSEQALRARSVAEWVWVHGGKDAEIEVITVAVAGEALSAAEAGSYRFIASELGGGAAAKIAD